VPRRPSPARLQFQAALIGSDTHDPSGKALADWRSTEGFWWTMITHNARMIKHNAWILEPHPWQTTWWEWIWNLRGLAEYSKDEGHRLHTHVYLLGNVAVLWPIAVAMVVALLVCGLYVRYRYAFPPGSHVHGFVCQAGFCMLGYFLNLLPYIGVARSTFTYHYMPALVFGQLLLPRVIEVLTPRVWQGTVIRWLLIAAAAVFLHFVPWIYALPLTSEAGDRRRWLPRWN